MNNEIICDHCDHDAHPDDVCLEAVGSIASTPNGTGEPFPPVTEPCFCNGEDK